MSRATIIVLIVSAALGVSMATWRVFQSEPITTETATPAPPANTKKRQRAEDFFGGDPNRSVRGGQEMKPRW